MWKLWASWWGGISDPQRVANHCHRGSLGSGAQQGGDVLLASCISQVSRGLASSEAKRDEGPPHTTAQADSNGCEAMIYLPRRSNVSYSCQHSATLDICSTFVHVGSESRHSYVIFWGSICCVLNLPEFNIVTSSLSFCRLVCI